MRICVDIDGVLFPWDQVARQALEERCGRAVPVSAYWHSIRDSVPREDWTWLWSDEGQAHVFGQVDRHYPGEVRAVRRLLDLRHDVHFVTHRDPSRTLAHTAAFLAHYFGYGARWAGVHSVRSSVEKHRLAAWDVLIDDKPSTVLTTAALERIKVFAPLRPWNAAELEDADSPWLTVYEDPEVITEWVQGNAR